MPSCPSGHESATSDYCDVCGAPMAGPGSAAAAPRAAATGPPPRPAATGQEPAPAPASAPEQTGTCPDCGAARTGRFCEGCGRDFVTGATLPPGSSPVSVPPAPAPGADTPAAAAAPGLAAPGVAPGAGGESAAAASGPPAAGGVPAAGAGAGTETAQAEWNLLVTADRGYYDSVIARNGPDAAGIAFPAYCPERTFALAGREIRIGRRSVSRGLAPEIDLSGPPLDPGISHLQAVLIAQPDGGWQLLDPGSANGTVINDEPAPIEVGTQVDVGDGDRIHIGAWTTITLRRAG